MNKTKTLRLLFIVPSLRAGGLEKVASTLANYLSSEFKLNVYIITLSNLMPFFHINNDITIIQPKKLQSFKIRYFNLLIKAIYIRIWLRKCVGKIKPNAILSFGEGYNAFVICSLMFLNPKIFVANRASPSSSLQGIRGKINPILYKYANGVIVQTYKAKIMLEDKYRNSRFHVIPNPVDSIPIVSNLDRKNIILNVGSFTGKKNQNFLIDYYSLLNENFREDWKINFIGNGPKMVQSKQLAYKKGIEKNVEFLGQKINVNEHYLISSIFAFTSTSEGFPNALAEAMAAGCACISYDCVAGPSDIIDDGINGFLIPVNDYKTYLRKLELLMFDKELRIKFGQNAKEKMKNYEIKNIARSYYQILFEDYLSVNV